jgi:hypothetical protein
MERKIMKGKKSALGKTAINRKGLIGESDKMLFWILMMIFIIGIIILVTSWVSGLKDLFINREIEPTVYEARLLYSPNCFAYQDPSTLRVYTGTVDLQKFNEDVLRRCVPLLGAAKHAMRIELQAQNGTVVDFVDTDNWNMNTQKVTRTKYFVYVYGNGPGIITFLHKEGTD